ncbi:MAG: M14 family metallopeptidase [Chitinophagaceae bacterium]
MRLVLIYLCTICCNSLLSQSSKTVFEQSNGLQTATYFNIIDYYNKLDAASNKITIEKFGKTDAGYPLHTVIFSNDKTFNSLSAKQKNKIVILINNGIHPGEPDGIDATMMLYRDMALGKINVPNNLVLVTIPVYNIGGCLNRNSTTRVNQNGPIEHGFRGNAQNLDLNRDFIKCDSKEAVEFIKIFQQWKPHIFIDNHVSDGADYQHIMTMLTTQHNKLGGEVGKFLHDVFEPSLYQSMKQKNFEMCPYVNFEDQNPDKGWTAFYDAPRYSSGYAALYSTMAFVPETHMLKPYKDRVYSTYAFMQTIIENAYLYANKIIENKAKDETFKANQQTFALSYKVDTSKFDKRIFNGYDTSIKISAVTKLPQYFYNHNKPYTKEIKFYNYFDGINAIVKPKAYIIPQGWHAVVDLLKINGVKLEILQQDTVIEVEAYMIEDYKTLPRPYEKHYKHSNVQTKSIIKKQRFLKGDVVVKTGSLHDRFLIETLEPKADDSYFNWNFFDAILQQKEGYSNYRWEAVAAEELLKNPTLQKQLNEKIQSDQKFANNANAILDYVYKNSKWYEPAHNLYPVFRLVN